MFALSLSQLEGALASLHDVAEPRRFAFQARLKHLQKLGFPAGINTGKGKRAAYTFDASCQILAALELMQFGLLPVHVVELLQANWTRSAAMASKVVHALSSILTEAMRRGLVAQNVARGVKVTRSGRDKKRIVIPEREQLKKLLEAAKSHTAAPEMRPLMMTAIFAGLRSSELRGLRWADVDLKAGTISINQRADAWGEIGAPKSEAGFRALPIGPALVSELRTWKLRSLPSPLGLVFPNETGKPLWQSNLHANYLAIETAAGLASNQGARFGLHCLRHAAASAWIKQGIDLKRLTTWMGHSSVQITLDTYGHLLIDKQGDAALAGGAEAALLA